MISRVPITLAKVNSMDTNRLDDMLERYGECCHQIKAAHILGVTPRTIFRMLEDGRLRRVGMSVDVRSICAYIENPGQNDLAARLQTKHTIQRNCVSAGEFLRASRSEKRGVKA